MDTAVAPVVEIAQGRLAGLEKDGVLRFNGIPYAKAKRWQMPEAPDGWTGVRDATRFGAIALQVPSASEAIMGGTPGVQDEDCLFLNVTTPACDDTKRPVMVWIHGGSFVTGAGSLGTYNGKHLAARGDVVVVTINYRLGAFGFLNLHDASGGKLPGTGVEGIADQIAALRWVKENITAFGGDPDNVTIFGESAGGMSVGVLLASPAARGLFHKAIAQSGAADIGMTRERSAGIAKMLLDKLGGADALAAASADVLQAQAALLAEPRATGALPFGPTVDGTILPKRAIEMVREGNAAGVTVLAGTTRDEWRAFTATLASIADERLPKHVAGLVGEERAAAILSVYREGTAKERWNEIMTDHAFMLPATRLLEAQAPHAPTYLYRFDWASPMMNGALGACHAIEIGFVFGTYKDKGAALFFGSGTQADALSDAMIQAWTTFAYKGYPGCEAAGAWQRYDAKSRKTMILSGMPPYMTGAPNEARRKAWDGVPDTMIGP